jgi:protease-4
LREKKPVVAYFGDVAASGGYYVGAPCQYIVAQPTTMTGSIGVVSVRLLAGALAERLGLRAQTLRSAPHADMGSPFRALDAAEQAMMSAELDAIYQSFVGVVAQGRQRLPEDIERLARGRVWSGADALRCGLVDALGGFDRALLALRELVPELRGLPEGEISLAVSSGARAQQPPPAAAPAPPVPSGALFWASLLEWCPSEIREALPLFGGNETALYYAFIPRAW